ncbi:MAG: PH domain-containing protein [Deltaproteobacteria bacterium]|nr:PH domain-containing protein [Deltaproteobacteria bacterium]
MIGSGKFFSAIEALPGERTRWEGGASRRAYTTTALRWIGLPLLGFLLCFFLYQLFASLMISAIDDAMQKVAAEHVHEPDSPAADGDREREAKESEAASQASPWAIALIIAVSLAAACLSLILIGLDFLWGLRRSWYVVTSERVCIQSGGFKRRLTTVDLDKIVSVESSASLLERYLGIESIRLVHAGHHGNGSRRSSQLYTMQMVDSGENVLSRLLHEWLPRDNRQST